MDTLGSISILFGTALLLLAAWGQISLPDALARQHAATKGGTLALFFILLGAACLHFETAWVWRLLLILIFLFATLPAASHLLARAAVHEAGIEDELRASPRVGDPPPQP